MSPVTCNATVNCCIAISFFQHGLHNISQSSWAQRWGKDKRCQNRGHANLSVFPCHPTPFGQKCARRGVRVFSNFFLKFQWKNSPQKSRRNHPRMERKRPFFCLPHIFTEHLRLTRCVNLRENPPHIDSELTRCKLDPISDSKHYEVLWNPGIYPLTALNTHFFVVVSLGW